MSEIEALEVQEATMAQLYKSWKAVEGHNTKAMHYQQGSTAMEQDMRDLEMYWRGLTATSLESIAERQIAKLDEVREERQHALNDAGKRYAVEDDPLEQTVAEDEHIHKSQYHGIKGMVSYRWVSGVVVLLCSFACANVGDLPVV